MQIHHRFVATLVPLVICMAVLLSTSNLRAQQADPWRPAQVVPPATLAARLAQQHETKPVILQIGFDVLYRSKHIPGALYTGPASTPEGLARLKAAVEKLPKSQEIYIYCGCCPIDKCPNIRPAFCLLQKMGFTNVKMLMLPTNFARDWIAPGYPIAGETAGSIAPAGK